MTLLQKINEELKQAMRDKDSLKRSVLRQLLAAVANEAIALGKKDLTTGASAKDLSDDEFLKVVKREARQRQDAMSQYNQAGESERAKLEKQELEILQTYLPEQLSKEEVRKIVGAAISQGRASGLGDFGKIMGLVMKQVGEQADGNMVKEIVKGLLESSAS